jgi:hypothetical protein
LQVQKSTTAVTTGELLTFDTTDGNVVKSAGDAATVFGNIKQQASTAATGVVEFATTVEAAAGTATTVAVTPAGVQAYVATQGFLTTTNRASTANAGLTEYASQTEMEAGTASTVAVTPSVFHNSQAAAKAWVMFNMVSDTVYGSYNVATVGSGSSGIGSISWGTDFTSTTYSMVGTGSVFSVSINSSTANTVGTGRIRCRASDATGFDSTRTHVVAFGDHA